jgi:hypothetical protein
MSSVNGAGSSEMALTALASGNGPTTGVGSVEDEDLVVAAQFAEARPRHVGELHLGVLGGRGTLRALDDVLPPAAGGLGHLVVLPPLGVVELRARLAVVEGQEAAAEPQRLELHDRGQRERMQRRKPPCLSNSSLRPLRDALAALPLQESEMRVAEFFYGARGASTSPT